MTAQGNDTGGGEAIGCGLAWAMYASCRTPLPSIFRCCCHQTLDHGGHLLRLENERSPCQPERKKRALGVGNSHWLGLASFLEKSLEQLGGRGP